MADVEIDTNVKDFTNRINFGIIVCTSGTRPTAVDGKTIYETDTDKLLIYNGASWVEITGGGVTDHGALTGLTDDDHTQYLLINGTREMTGTLDMGANNVYLDSGILRMSDGTALSGSIGFTTGVQNYIQRQLVSGSDYTLLSDQDYMHTWAILGTEKMHLSTADGLKLFTKINMNGLKIEGVLDPTANQEAATKKYVDDNIGTSDHSLLSNLTWSTAGHTINTSIDMNNNNITDLNELWFNTSDPGIKFDTGDFIWFDTSEDRIYFEIASDNICYVRPTGLHPDNTDTYYLGSGSSYWKALYATSLVVDVGAYITSDVSANMELHVATGKTVKIVVG